MFLRRNRGKRSFGDEGLSETVKWATVCAFGDSPSGYSAHLASRGNSDEFANFRDDGGDRTLSTRSPTLIVISRAVVGTQSAIACCRGFRNYRNPVWLCWWWWGIGHSLIEKGQSRMYAGKRRQRNFKRVRDTAKPGAPTNPSKRHRERLNGELETVASLLPFDDATLQRLDKLSVLRLAVSFLQIKAHFQVCGSQLQTHGICISHPLALPPIPMGPVPSFVESGFPLVDPIEPLFSQVALKALGGFVLILNEIGEIYFVSENIEFYLGFIQSDILHQPIFDMIHSEDREDIRSGLQCRSLSRNVEGNGDENVERVMVARFRCLLDNTCGFIRVEIRGRITELHASVQLHSGLGHRSSPRFGLVAVCTPFVPPLQIDVSNDDPILKTKHSLDLSLLCMDNRFRVLVEEGEEVGGTFYDLIHPDDVRYVSEAHSAVIKNTSSGLMIYRLISRRTETIIYVQSSLRVFFKSSKAESIGGTHRTLTEVDGLALLEKRSGMKAKYLTFDDTLLQSPRHIHSAATLPHFPPNPQFDAVLSAATSMPTTEPPPLVSIPSAPQHFPLNNPTNGHFLSPPFLSFPLPDGGIIPPDFNSVLFHSAQPTDQEALWANGFKAPIGSDAFPFYYSAPPQLDPINAQTSNYGYPTIWMEPAAADYSAYGSLPPTLSLSNPNLLKPPTENQPKEIQTNETSSLAHHSSTNNFSFISEVAHTLLGTH